MMKNSTFPELRSTRLRLRRFAPGDLEYVFQGLSHPEVIKHYGVHYSSREEVQEQMQWFSNLEKSGTGIWWAITSTAEKTFFGAIGLNDLQKEHYKAEIGFWLLPEFQKKGIIAEALPLVLHQAFKEMQLHRIEAFVETGNIASKKALEKLHFRHEGTMRDCEFKNGQFISIDIFAKLANE